MLSRSVAAVKTMNNGETLTLDWRLPLTSS
jgi:hypothetical protein